MASDSFHWSDDPDRPVSETAAKHEALSAPVVRLWRVLEYSGAYLAAIAVAEVLLVMHILSLPLSPAPLLGALITFAVYANDRRVDVDSDVISNPNRTAFVERHADTLYVIAAIAYGLGTALAALGGPLVFGLALLPGGVWLVYAVGWTPMRIVPVARLKEIIVINSLLVSGAWSISVILVPIAYANAPLSPTVGVMFIYFVLATFVNTELANLHDVGSDIADGVSTLPTVLGVQTAKRVLTSLVLVLGALVAGAGVAGVVTWPMALALGLCPVGLFCIVALLGRVETALLAIASEFSRVPVLFALVLLGI